MNKRAALAVFVGTVVLFVWGAISHMVIIRGVGYAPLPNEAALQRVLADVEPGLYAFPAPPDWSGKPLTEASSAAWVDRFTSGPSGLLTVRQLGAAPFSVTKLVVQLVADALAVLLAVWVLTGVRGPRWRRVASATSFGAVATLTVSVISWNWYAFTDAFFAAQALDVIGGWTLVGLAVTTVLSPDLNPSSPHSTPAAR